MNHTDIFIGISVLQFVYIAYQYFLLRRVEYLYYLIYISIISLIVLFKVHPELNPVGILVTDQEPFTAGRGLFLLGIAFYYRFGRHYTEAKLLYERLNRQLVIFEWILIGWGTFDILTQLAGMDYNILEPFSLAFFIMAIPFSVYVIIFLLSQGRVLTNILVIGSSLLLIFSSIGLFLIKTRYHELTQSYFQLFNEIGMVSELLFLNFGLIYKTRMLERENIRLELARQSELNRQRMEISSDLHDEVGATLSGIALYSHLAGSQINAEHREGLKNSIDTIKQSASDMVNKLNDIIWTVDPRHDSVGDMVSHLEEYMLHMCAVSNIRPVCSCDDSLKKAALPMNARKEVYLICKEAINNAVKYSRCDELVLKINRSDDAVLFEVKDNGIGFDDALNSRGNGIINMKKRAAVMGASLKITTVKGAGSTISLRVML